MQLYFLCLALFSNALSRDDSQQPVIKATEVEVRADKIIWRYKVINGKLYNTTTDTWIGNWIPV